MSENLQNSRRVTTIFVSMVLAMIGTASLHASETTVLVISDQGGAVTGEFLGGTCDTPYFGKSGCLKMKKGKRDKKFKIFFADETAAENWDWVALEIRMPFSNWGDPVDADVLSDLSITGPPSFNANGQADLSMLGGPVLHIKNKNLHKFIIQYRIKVSNGTASDDFWIHPILENEG